MILVNMNMPKGCVECAFCEGCKEPKDFPMIECKLIGKVGSMFNFAYGRPTECPLQEYTASVDDNSGLTEVGGLT